MTLALMQDIAWDSFHTEAIHDAPVQTNSNNKAV